MIIFLYGPDDYRRSQKKRDFIAEFKKKRSESGISVFDFSGSTKLTTGSKDVVAQFEEFVGNQSLFEVAKLAVLENAFEELEAKQLAKLLEPLAEHKTTTVLLPERDKPVKALGFLIEKPTLFQKFENLEGPAWTSFIIAEAKKLGVSLSASAAQFLGTVYQGNTWALITELQKLAGLKSTIDKNDLDALDLEAAPNYWALLNGLKSTDARMRLVTLEKMLVLNDPPPKIFNILAAQWQEKTPQIAELDFAVKSGKLEYEEALLQLLIG
jgi:DNA polymerase III delta subunit